MEQLSNFCEKQFAIKSTSKQNQQSILDIKEKQRKDFFKKEYERGFQQAIDTNNNKEI